MGTDVQGLQSVYQALFGLIADRPAAATLPDGSIYYATDTAILSQVQAGAWVNIVTPLNPAMFSQPVIHGGAPAHVVTGYRLDAAGESVLCYFALPAAFTPASVEVVMMFPVGSAGSHVAFSWNAGQRDNSENYNTKSGNVTPSITATASRFVVYDLAAEFLADGIGGGDAGLVLVGYSDVAVDILGLYIA